MNARRLAWLAATLALSGVHAGCVHHDLDNVRPDPQICCAPRPWAEGDKGKVDLLFVVDNSGSMYDEQAQLKAQFTALMSELRQMKDGLPDLHIGVTSTDLGTGSFQITYCEDVGGDAGQLLTGNCTNPTGGQPFIVDVAPEGCEITRTDDATGTCAAHDCTQAHCSHEPTATLMEDPLTGCPRCRNYTGEPLESVFSCIAGLGTQGCGFEQPLEAMVQALDNNAWNTGFLRENAMLAVVLVTDEDDCSARSPELFDNTQTEMSSTLGPLTSFRCFEFGVVCDQDTRTYDGLRTGCVPREDPAGLLHPISRYAQFLQALKHPDYLVISAIAGPLSPQGVQTSLDASGFMEVGPSCQTSRGGATPAIRIRSLLETFNAEEDLDWAHTSICSDSYVSALEGVGRKVAEAIEANCPFSPFWGCPDVAAEYGLPGDGQGCNDVCGADCQVTDIVGRGTASEYRAAVPPCLEVCADGPCPGNTDRSLAYAQGHPELIDPALPVASCWHIRYQPICERSNDSEIVIARQADPPPRTFSEKLCRMIPQHEALCNDGVDNDEDCLVDGEDPDCP